MIFTCRRAYIQPVAPSVAREPKIISSGSPAPIFTRLDSTQPRVSPGMAAGVNSANTFSASDTRNCTAAEVVPGSSRFWA